VQSSVREICKRNFKETKNEFNTKISFLSELDGKPSRDLLKFRLTVELGVDPDSTLGSSEWNIHARTLVGHEGSKSFHFINTHVHSIADTWKT